MTQEIYWLQFKVSLSLPEVTAIRNRKHRREYTSPPRGSSSLPGAWSAVWAGAGPSQPCPHRALQERRAATALPKLLAPVNIRQAICFPLSTGREPGWHGRALHRDMVVSLSPWQPTWLSCTWLCSGWMGSGRVETFCNCHKKDRALCCGHPWGGWGYGHTSP